MRGTTVQSDFLEIKDLISELIEICFGQEARVLSDGCAWPEEITGEPRPRGKLVRRSSIGPQPHPIRKRTASEKQQQVKGFADSLRVNSMRDQMSFNMISALRRGDIVAVAMTSYGRIYEIPVNLWVALEARRAPVKVKFHVQRGALQFDVEGRVLFPREQAEAWLEMLRSQIDPGMVHGRGEDDPGKAALAEADGSKDLPLGEFLLEQAKKHHLGADKAHARAKQAGYAESTREYARALFREHAHELRRARKGGRRPARG